MDVLAALGLVLLGLALLAAITGPDFTSGGGVLLAVYLTYLATLRPGG